MRPTVFQGLRVEKVSKHFTLGGGLFGGKRQLIRAVNNVSFDVAKGHSVGLVGESGCGKSTVSRAVLRLVEADEGSIAFEGTNILSASPREMRQLRRRLQFVFQDPYASLNPRRTIRQTLEEPLYVHGCGGKAEIRE